jgi:hypothetical protein
LSTKANDRRVKTALERTRLALKAEQLDIEKRRREQSRERELALPVLRLLCGLYGDNDWPDETPLPEILEGHLAAPLGAQMTQIRAYVSGLQQDLARARHVNPRKPPETPENPREVPTPTPLRPTLVPQQEHRVKVVPAELRGERGFRAACVCGWRSPLQAAEATALVLSEAHIGADRRRQGIR